MERKIIPSGPHFFILPIWEENGERKIFKIVNNVIYTNTFTLLHSPNSHSISYMLYNKDMIVNLYKLHFPSSLFSFQPNKKVFHPPTYPPLQPNTHKEKPNLFYPPTNFPSFHFSTPPSQTDPNIEQTDNIPFPNHFFKFIFNSKLIMRENVLQTHHYTIISIDSMQTMHSKWWLVPQAFSG